MPKTCGKLVGRFGKSCGALAGLCAQVFNALVSRGKQADFSDWLYQICTQNLHSDFTFSTAVMRSLPTSSTGPTIMITKYIKE